MLVNGGQEMDSARDCKYKFSINLVMRKREYRPNPVNYPFGIQFILLLSIIGTLRHIKCRCQLLYFGHIVFVCSSSSLLLLLHVR